jgi:hypothetical protein
LAKSVHGEEEAAGENRMVARNQEARKQDAVQKRFSGTSASDIARLQAEQRLVAIFGAPGRTGAAHVVQFRPVRVECGYKEALPEGPKSVGSGGLPGEVVALGGNGCRRDRCHDAGSLFFFTALAAFDAVFRAGNQLWPDSLKEGFNCSHLPRHGVGLVSIRGERMENAQATCAGAKGPTRPHGSPARAVRRKGSPLSVRNPKSPQFVAGSSANFGFERTLEIYDSSVVLVRKFS